MQWWAFYAPASFRLGMFWIFLCAWTSVFFCATHPFLCSPEAVYQHVQSNHIHTCLPSQEERGKFVHFQYSRDDLLSFRPACLTPDLAARLRSLDIGFCWPRRRTRRGERRKVKKISVVSCPRTDHVRSSKATDQGLCELGGGRNLLNLINVIKSKTERTLNIL